MIMPDVSGDYVIMPDVSHFTVDFGPLLGDHLKDTKMQIKGYDWGITDELFYPTLVCRG